MSCLAEFDNLCDFISHLKLHIKDGVKVACPFSGCIKWFSAHKCRCHEDWTSNYISVDNSRDNEVVLHVENSTSNDAVDGRMCCSEQSDSEEHDHSSHFRDDHSQIETDIDDPAEGTYNLQDLKLISAGIIFFKTNFNYVQQVELYLGKDSNMKERYYQYVPIKETISALFKYQFVQRQHT